MEGPHHHPLLSLKNKESEQVARSVASKRKRLNGKRLAFLLWLFLPDLRGLHIRGGFENIPKLVRFVSNSATH